MRFSVIVLALCTMLGSRLAAAQGAPAPESRAAESRAAESAPAMSATAASAAVNGGVPIGQVIAAVARKSGKKFVVDPRVRGDVALFGQSPSDVTYSELLTILHVYGYAGVETAGYVEVIPDATVRSEPVPIVTGKEKLPDDEYVSATIHLQSANATMLVPILRPLLPQQAHLASYTCGNTLMIVDRFANYKRIEALVRAIDVGPPHAIPDGCDRPSSAQRDGVGVK